MNAGAELSAVRLNGRMPPVDPSRGRRPRANRVPVDLRDDESTFVVETNGRLFLSATDTGDW